MRVISNSSPLIALDRVGQLSLLRSLFGSIGIPPAVAREIRTGKTVIPAWVETTPLRSDPAPIDLPPSLGEGEREAIVLAHQTEDSLLIMDDRAGRDAARKNGVRITGTVGILLVAKEGGHLAAVRPVLTRLREAGFHIGDTLFRLACERTGEEGQERTNA